MILFMPLFFRGMAKTVIPVILLAGDPLGTGTVTTWLAGCQGPPVSRARASHHLEQLIKAVVLAGSAVFAESRSQCITFP